MPATLLIAKSSSIAMLILTVALAAQAQNTALGYSEPQNLTNYLQSRLSDANLNGRAAPPDIHALQKEADHGDAKAELILGEDYYIGANGLPQDLTRAAAYFRESAERGNAEAQFDFGIMNFNGQGMPLDSAQAAAWYRKAANQGNVLAQYSLGSLYAEGQGVSQNDTQAAAWYRKAADQGMVFAQYNLGLFYDLGRGVPQDYTQAAKWYRKAAEQKMASAQYNLGLLYSHGEGVAQDSSQAAGWFRKAAEQGDAEAQYDLGVAYAKGTGVKQDYREAYFWISLAAKGKVEGTERQDIDRARDVTASYLTAAELSQAQGRAQNWLKGHSM